MNFRKLPLILLFLALAPIISYAAPEDVAASIPYVSVASYKLAEGMLAPGEEAVLRLELECPASCSGAYNIISGFYFPSDGACFLEGESNQRYIEEIPAGESVYINLGLKIDEENQSRFAVIELNMSYTDANGNVFGNSSLITPAVSKKCGLEINFIDIAGEAVLGEQTPQKAEIVNSGGLAARSVKMEITGDAGWKGEVDFGDLEPGERVSKDFLLMFNEPGEQYLSVCFTCEDELGNMYSTPPREYTVIAVKQRPAGFASGPGGNAEPLVYAGLAATILALAVLLVISIRRNGGGAYGA